MRLRLTRVLCSTCGLVAALAGTAVTSPVRAAEVLPAPSALQAAPPIMLVLGADLSPQVQARLTALLRQVQTASSNTLQTLTPERAEATPQDGASSPALTAFTSAPGLILALGSSPLATAIIPDQELHQLKFDGFIVRSARRGLATVIAARGSLRAPSSGSTATAATSPTFSLATNYAAYAALEELGFGFLRPLAPTVPAALTMPTAPVEIAESPRWRVRAMHIHTQHPLELTNLLQGWGKTGPDDAAGFAAMLPEWESYLEWLVANRQNRVEWPLLWADSWRDFAGSHERIARLKQLVDLGHAYGIGIGLDVPLTFQQQHSYRLITKTGNRASELAQVDAAVDWLMQAGFDFFGTETGTSEFTHPEPADQLAWMNELAVYASTKYGKPVYIKVHCSTGQTAAGYPDPVTGAPINFNMLPIFADSRLGVLPHTVEIYGLDDPAPTYGNTDFSYMRSFIRREAGKREVVFYPETAYWVGFDIDVPLFLPIYGERRLHDLRLIAADEDAGLTGEGAHAGSPMDGQLNFSSGWEWGYWLNDVLAARAVWDPAPQIATDQAAMLATTTKVLRVFGNSAPAVAAWVEAVASAEKSLLIDGEVNGVKPAAIYQRGGQAYLEGFQSLTDLSDLLSHIPGTPSAQTQPARLGLLSGRGAFDDARSPDYTADVAPLLSAMDTTFSDLLAQGQALQLQVPPAARDLFADLLAAAEMTSLRATQQHGLYDFALLKTLNTDEKSQRLATARAALDAAQTVVAAREPHYAVPDPARIAGWQHSQPGPTVYEYGYLWTVHSLYYWWRDEAKAVSTAHSAAQSPCFRNIIDPVDLGFGDGSLLTASHWLASLFPVGPEDNCLAVPSSEPHYSR